MNALPVALHNAHDSAHNNTNTTAYCSTSYSSLPYPTLPPDPPASRPRTPPVQQTNNVAAARHHHSNVATPPQHPTQLKPKQQHLWATRPLNSTMMHHALPPSPSWRVNRNLGLSLPKKPPRAAIASLAIFLNLLVVGCWLCVWQ